MLKTIYTLLLITFNLQTIFSQEVIYKAYANGVIMEEINYHDYKKIENPKTENFVGNYGFGDSESETTLEIIYSNKKLYARDVWHNIGGAELIIEIKRLPIEFKNGITLIDMGAYELYKCIEDSFNNKKGDIGIGSIYSDIENGVRVCSLGFHQKGGEIKIDGKYPETSFVKLTRNELEVYAKREMKIMRNEIFARNGHLFKQNGDMDNYFSKQTWYKKIKKVNGNDLSEIEKYNVKLIRSLE